MKNSDLRIWIPYEHISVPESLAHESERNMGGLAWEAAHFRRVSEEVRRST